MLYLPNASAETEVRALGFAAWSLTWGSSTTCSASESELESSFAFLTILKDDTFALNSVTVVRRPSSSIRS